MVRRELAVDAAASCSHGGSVFEHELVLRVTELTDRVRHVDSVVYHHRDARRVPDPIDEEVRAAVVDEALRRRGASLRAVAGAAPTEVRLLPALSERPRVSVVIPTAGTARRIRGELTTLVLNCVDSILANTAYPDLEVICVVDGTAPEPVRAQLHHMEGKTESLSFKVIPFNEPFNFSVKINRGVAHASGEHLLLLNDDIEVTDPAWIDTLVGVRRQPGDRSRRAATALRGRAAPTRRRRAHQRPRRSPVLRVPSRHPGLLRGPAGGVEPVGRHGRVHAHTTRLLRGGGRILQLARGQLQRRRLLPEAAPARLPDRVHARADALALRVVEPGVPAAGAARDRTDAGAVGSGPVRRPVLQPPLRAAGTTSRPSRPTTAPSTTVPLSYRDWARRWIRDVARVPRSRS